MTSQRLKDGEKLTKMVLCLYMSPVSLVFHTNAKQKTNTKFEMLSMTYMICVNEVGSVTYSSRKMNMCSYLPHWENEPSIGDLTNSILKISLRDFKTFHL